MTAPSKTTESSFETGVRLAQQEAAERLTQRIRQVWVLLEDEFSKVEDLASLYGELHGIKKHSVLPEAQKQTLDLMKRLIEKEVGSRGYRVGYFRQTGKLKVEKGLEDPRELKKRPRKPGPKPAAKVAKKRGRKPGPKKAE